METLPDDKVKLRFVDYGNEQVTPLNECVYLSAEYSKFKPSAVQCVGVAYLDENDYQKPEFEKLLINGNQAEPMEWQARFIRDEVRQRPLILIDKLLCLANRANQQFNPSIYKEAIAQPVLLTAGQTVDVRFSSINGNFKYIYYNLKSLTSGLEQLEKGIVYKLFVNFVFYSQNYKKIKRFQQDYSKQLL